MDLGLNWNQGNELLPKSHAALIPQNNQPIQAIHGKNNNADS